MLTLSLNASAVSTICPRAIKDPGPPANRRKLRDMNAQMTFQRICAISGIICPLLFFGAFVSAGFIPPLAPSSTAAEIAGHYRDHATGIRLGAAIMLLSGAFYASYTAVISAQM